MKREELIVKERKLLEQLEQRFAEQQLLTQWQLREDNGMTDILYVDHNGVGSDGDEVLGSYYFLPPDQGEPLMHRFIMGMTVTEELHSWNLDLIREAVAEINYLLPVGAFVIDHKKSTLTYRLGIPFLPDEPAERMMELIGYYLVETMQYVSLWIDALLYLNEGRISYAEFDEYLKMCMTRSEES